MSELKTTKSTFLEPLKEFEASQKKLVKENPFVKITDTDSFEAGKKSRTALLKGRTALQAQQTDINSKVNALKSAVKEETERLIAITSPAEEKQQKEVKNYEFILETKRKEREKEKQDKIDEAKSKIDDLISICEQDIEGLKFEGIAELQEESEEFFSMDTSQFEDLEMYFSGKIAVLRNKMESKIKELNQAEELKQSQAETKYLKFSNEWSNKVFTMTYDNMNDINTEFDTKVPEMDSKDFYDFSDAFLIKSKSIRDQIGNRMIELKKIQEEKVKNENEEIRQNNIKASVDVWYLNAEKGIHNMTFEKIHSCEKTLSEQVKDIKSKLFYTEIQEIIDLKIDKLVSLHNLQKQIRIDDNTAKEKFESDKLAEEKKIAEQKKKDDKKASADEKKRQLKLKLPKSYAINTIKSVTEIPYDAKGNETDSVMTEFFIELGDLNKKYIKLINEL